MGTAKGCVAIDGPMSMTAVQRFAACFPLESADGDTILDLHELGDGPGGALVGRFVVGDGPAREVVLVPAGARPSREEELLLAHWCCAIVWFALLPGRGIAALPPAALFGNATGPCSTRAEAIAAQLASSARQQRGDWTFRGGEWDDAHLAGARGTLDFARAEEPGRLVVTHGVGGLQRTEEVDYLGDRDHDPERVAAYGAAVGAIGMLFVEVVPFEAAREIELQDLFPHALLEDRDLRAPIDFVLAWLASEAVALLDQAAILEPERLPMARRARLPALGVFTALALTGLGVADPLTHLVGGVLSARVTVAAPALIFYYAASTPGDRANQFTWSSVLACALVALTAAGMLVTRGPHGFSTGFDALCLIAFFTVVLNVGVRMWSAEG